MTSYAEALPGGRKAWRVKAAIPESTRASLSAHPPLVAQLLYNRGLTKQQQARQFLAPTTISHDPYLLPGMDAAVQRLRRAIRNHERVAVFGDFDVDGISATALLTRALSPVGCKVIPYIPHRVREGHGLSTEAVTSFIKQGVNLLVTVDCGVSSVEEIAEASRAGIDTIVTDHHLPLRDEPPACAVVDPRLPTSRYPFDGLTGAGLALKLAEALYDAPGVKEEQSREELLALATLGTIADVAPLVDENRSIVREGLRALASAPSPGLSALMRVARVNPRSLSSDSVGWAIAPRLNAAGRLDRANPSYRLLVTQSPVEAERLAAKLEEQNRVRQQLTWESYERAKGLLAEHEVDASHQALLMASHATFSPGIVGLVAGRLTDEYARPAVVVSVDGELGRGSCRSVPWFNIGRALHDIAGAVGGFIRHGGHAQAAGFTVHTARLPALYSELSAVAHAALRDRYDIDPAHLRPSIDVDIQLPLRAMPKNIWSLIRPFAPFGPDNSEPVFLSRNVSVVDVRRMGAGEQHLRLRLHDGSTTWSAVAFHQGHSFPNGVESLDLVYAVDVEEWQGIEALQLRILDFAPAR